MLVIINIIRGWIIMLKWMYRGIRRKKLSSNMRYFIRRFVIYFTIRRGLITTQIGFSLKIWAILTWVLRRKRLLRRTWITRKWARRGCIRKRAIRGTMWVIGFWAISVMRRATIIRVQTIRFIRFRITMQWTRTIIRIQIILNFISFFNNL